MFSFRIVGIVSQQEALGRAEPVRILEPRALPSWPHFCGTARIGEKEEPILSKERACRLWKAERGQAEELLGCTACWGSGALKSFSVLSLECRTRYSQWTLKRSTGTGGSRGIHYSRHKIFYSGLQHIIIQMSRAQQRENMQADFCVVFFPSSLKPCNYSRQVEHLGCGGVSPLYFYLLRERDLPTASMYFIFN